MLLNEADLTEFCEACSKIADANRNVTEGQPALAKLEDRLDTLLQTIGPLAVIIMAMCIERHLSQVAIPTLQQARKLTGENILIFVNDKTAFC